MTKEVTTPEEQSVHQAVPYIAPDDSGMDDLDSSDFSVPMLRLLQPLSKNVLSPPDHLKDKLKAGLVLNNLTEDVSEEVDIVFATIRKVYIEWVPASKGGGMQGIYHKGDPFLTQFHTSELEKACVKLTNGNDLVKTLYMYGVQIDADGNTTPVVIPMSKTQLKPAAKILGNVKLRKFTRDGLSIPTGLNRVQFKLGTVSRTNDKGTWYVWVIKDTKLIDETATQEDEALYNEAVSLSHAIKSGEHDIEPDAKNPDGPF